MTTRSPAPRAITALLLASLLFSSLPAPLPAQTPPPPGAPSEDRAAARERLRQLRERQRNASRPPAPGASAPAGQADMPSSQNENGERVYQLKLKEANLDQLLDRYSELTGRTMIKAPGVNATVTFSAADYLTRDEMIQAMDAILTMNNITLVPLGSQFYRVVQIDKSSTEGMQMSGESPTPESAQSDAIVRHLVKLNYLSAEDALNLVQPMLHGYGKVQRLDRISSLLILETAANLRTILDILDMVDQPTELKVETKIYEIHHAKAADIAARLNELASDSQEGQKDATPQVAAPAPPGARRTPNMIRARQPESPDAAASADAKSREAAAAEKGIIQGKVKILTDERTNIIIVISDPVNFTFFDKIVEVLDVSVDPEVIVEVVALQFADAEETANLLNDFIGASTSKTDSSSRANPAASDSANRPGRNAAQAIDDFARQRAEAANRARNAVGEAAAAKLGQLSDSTKILSDKRTNTLLLMGTKADVAALRDVIRKVDIMLAQVLIEAVILEVNLNNSSDYGFKWLQKTMTAYNNQNTGGLVTRTPVVSWGGGFGGADFSSAAGDTISRATTLGSSAAYYLTFHELNIDAFLNMLDSSGESRILATPVVLTTDNTEAKIISGQSIPVRTGDSSYSSGSYYGTYEYKDVGIELDVTPRINPDRYVTLEISQSANTLGDQVDVGNNSTMYTINKREMNASISVPSRSTIVLGGLVQTDASELNTRIPILGSIPLIGALFRSSSKSRKRTELLVLITPYVLRTPEEARAETERLHRASNVTAEEWYRGWSDSPLAPVNSRESPRTTAPVIDYPISSLSNQPPRSRTETRPASAPSGKSLPRPAALPPLLDGTTGDGDSPDSPSAAFPLSTATLTATYIFDPSAPMTRPSVDLHRPDAEPTAESESADEAEPEPEIADDPEPEIAPEAEAAEPAPEFEATPGPEPAAEPVEALAEPEPPAESTRRSLFNFRRKKPAPNRNPIPASDRPTTSTVAPPSRQNRSPVPEETAPAD